MTATLTSSVTGLALAGETVTFTLDNVAVGMATTNASGVATLPRGWDGGSGGVHPGAVVANFAGDTDYLLSQGTGDLTVIS